MKANYSKMPLGVLMRKNLARINVGLPVYNSDNLIKNALNSNLLLLLIMIDLLFICLHVYQRLTESLSPLFLISRDMGYGEMFQYAKEFSVVTLLLFLAVRRSSLLYFNWALLFFYFLLDDSIKIHERLGLFLSNFFGFQPTMGLRAIDFGELLVSVGLGGLIVSCIIIAYYKSHTEARKTSEYLFVMIVLLAFFGIMFDMVHSMVKPRLIRGALGTIEDGGEMVIMSFITWFVFRRTKSLIKSNSKMIVKYFENQKFLLWRR